MVTSGQDLEQFGQPATSGGRGLGGWLLALLRHPWMAMLLQDSALCRILAAIPLPLLALPLLHLRGWSCPWHELTGIPCPGCGMTRAAVAMLHGHFEQALILHPFAPAAAGAWLLLATGAVLPAPNRRWLAAHLEAWERRLAPTGMVLIAFILFGLGRMATSIWAKYAILES